jgi:hypothetical protein
MRTASPATYSLVILLSHSTHEVAATLPCSAFATPCSTESEVGSGDLVGALVGAGSAVGHARGKPDSNATFTETSRGWQWAPARWYSRANAKAREVVQPHTMSGGDPPAYFLIAAMLAVGACACGCVAGYFGTADTPGEPEDCEHDELAVADMSVAESKDISTEKYGDLGGLVESMGDPSLTSLEPMVPALATDVPDSTSCRTSMAIARARQRVAEMAQRQRVRLQAHGHARSKNMLLLAVMSGTSPTSSPGLRPGPLDNLLCHGEVPDSAHVEPRWHAHRTASYARM